MVKIIDNRNIVSTMLPHGVVEMTVDHQQERTWFQVSQYGMITQESNLKLGREEVFPYPYNYDLIKHKVVLFPSKAKKFKSETDLRENVQAFIHKYLDVSEPFELLATYYVFMTWVYDSFSELPYLRAIGDYGSGKTRFLQTIGSLCYKPMFAGGATTVSPIFRIIEDFNGTLILDEADYKSSSATQDITKILNNGFARGFPVLRSEGKRSYAVKSFNVFGPKIIATRFKFDDPALESRFIIEVMKKGSLRQDIPRNLTDLFWEEAEEIRNQLLSWRFINWNKKGIKWDLNLDKEPRRVQILGPVLSMIEDEKILRKVIKNL